MKYEYDVIQFETDALVKLETFIIFKNNLELYCGPNFEM